jgi:PST family polysaccharide transporter
VFAFGIKWEMSGQIMTILSFGIAPFVIGLHVNAALTASGHSRMVMTMATISFAINCCLGLLFVPYGLVIAAWGFALRGFIINCMGIFWFKKAFGIPISHIPKAVAPSLIASLLMFIAIHFANPIFAKSIPAILNIAFLCVTGGLVYVFVMLVIFRKATGVIFTEAEDMAPQKFKPLLISLRGCMRLTR